MNEITVTSWIDLIESLHENTWQPSLNRYRSDYAYRGVSDASHADLETSLMRLGGDYAEMEGHLLRNFRKYSHLEAIHTVAADSVWYWLAMAQHHGLPTRLLDWTYSPFVAMHFATASLDDFECDGLIWGINYVETNRFLPRTLEAILEEEGAHAFTAEMLQRVAMTLGQLDALAGDEGAPAGQFVAFFEPPSLDARIINQWALFSLMSSPTVSLDEWLEAHPDLVRRIVIPAEVKWEVRDKLDQANITERVLFPGLDGLSSWLRRHYSPRWNGNANPSEDELAAQTTARRVPTEQS